MALASWLPAREHGEQGAHAPGVAYVSHLYVHPDRWGQGIARGLLGLDVRASGGRDGTLVRNDMSRTRRRWRAGPFPKRARP